MMLSLAYFLTVAMIVPFLPYLIFKAKKIRRSVPELPEAEGIMGTIGDEAIEHKLLFIGESTIAGVGVTHHKEGIAGRTAHYLHQTYKEAFEWQVVARSGYRTREVISKLLKKLPKVPPKVVIIGMGGNDTFKLTPPARFSRELENITSHLKLIYPNAPVIIASLPPVRLFPAFEGVVAKLLGIVVRLHAQAALKLHQPSQNTYVMPSMLTYKQWEMIASYPLEDLFSDGVHPSSYTYDLWAKTIAQYIKENELV